MSQVPLTAELIEAGGTLIPLRPDDPKVPATSGYQNLVKCIAPHRASLLQANDGKPLPGNRGLLTGPDRIEMPDGTWSGVDVLDVDEKPERPNGKGGIARAKHGRQRLRELEAKLGPMPKTLMARSASGADHYFFKSIGIKVSNRIFGEDADIEFMNAGHQVVFARSEITAKQAKENPRNIAGRYEWVDRSVPVAELPAQWIAYMLAERKNTSEPGVNSPIPADMSDPAEQWREDEAIDYCVSDAPVAVLGEKGEDAAFKVALHLVRKLRLPFDLAEKIMVDAWGPRCTPPSMWRHAKLIHKLEDARDNSDMEFCPLSSMDVERLKQIMRDAANGCGSGHMRKRVKAAKRRLEGLPPLEETESKRRARHVQGAPYSFNVGDANRPEMKAHDAVPESADADVKASLPINRAVRFLREHHEWTRVLAYNEVKRNVEAFDPPVQLDAETDAGFSDSDVVAIRCWFESTLRKSISKENVRDAIEQAARANSYDPIVEYLESCERKPGILDDAAKHLLGSTDEIALKWFKQFLVGCARRAIRPGTKHDEALILYGAQSAGKSTFVEVLFGTEYTLTQRLDLEDVRKTGEFIKDAWGAELGELNGMNKARVETVKQFLTMTIDKFLPPYGHAMVKNPRRTCFIGTTNAPEFLNDPTGGRRFLTIEVKQKINLEWLRANRDAMWGDAMAYAVLPTSKQRPDLAGTDQVFDHWDEDLTKGNEARAPFTVEDDWHDIIYSHVCGNERVKVADIYVRALDGKAKDMGKREGERIRNVLTAIGCKPAKDDGERFWKVPEELAAVKKRIDINDIDMSRTAQLRRAQERQAAALAADVEARKAG